MGTIIKLLTILIIILVVGFIYLAIIIHRVEAKVNTINAETHKTTASLRLDCTHIIGHVKGLSC
jgi:hypothetical protein